MTYEYRSINLPSDVFALAVHPSRPLLSTGLSSGHVYSYTWSTSDDIESEDDDDEETQRTTLEELKFSLAWKTRRHKGSCRCAAYSANGDVFYTAGTDSLFKIADSETGNVVSKALVHPANDPATAVLPLSPEHLLIGTDSGRIYLYDVRDSSTFTSARSSASWDAHSDYISSLNSLPASGTSTTGFSRHFIATGDTTLSYLDVRKTSNILAKSEDQEDEMLCATYVANAPSRQTGGSGKVLTGTAGGVVTTWTRGFWEDHQDRIPISRGTGDSVEAILTLPDDFEIPGHSGWGAYFAAGAGDGKIRIVKIGQNKILSTLAHSYSTDEAKHMAGTKGDFEEGLEEGVNALALDYEGRLVSAGGMVVKLWTPKKLDDDIEDSKVPAKRPKDDALDSEDEQDSDEDSSDEEKEKKEKLKRRKKKRKGGKGKAKSAGVKNVHGFKGLD